MRPLRTKIKTECQEKAVPQYVIEKDYALSYLLAGIANQPKLCDSLVFKGGTALKKIYFGEYRFSEDLDFSGMDAPKGSELEKELQKAVLLSKELLASYGPFEIDFKRNPEQAPHPQGQEAFIANVKFPWHPNPQCRIKIKVTQDEPVIKERLYKPILHGYEETLEAKIACYQIEEIIAEKMRALLQTHEKLVARGWTRSRLRDYYDLWRILTDYMETIDKAAIPKLLKEKCRLRNVDYSDIDDFFTEELVNDAQKHWQGSLGALIKDLPECGHVLGEAKRLMRDIV